MFRRNHQASLLYRGSHGLTLAPKKNECGRPVRGVSSHPPLDEHAVRDVLRGAGVSNNGVQERGSLQGTPRGVTAPEGERSSKNNIKTQVMAGEGVYVTSTGGLSRRIFLLPIHLQK
ncbi:hypothetical protein TraAM80_05328 [Trypanosoma rangeli]|uniref:Uncharacterized protein n=1 Tax=Trypanosoma rangeli TaxID=5698 RepID=A0A3R7K9W1_TRYRA|nr:uncharacterized protein TraAM80_05328 [Trypanosoma rangeli]RNF04051.1 hypothetical protein TraAM80_05328 [Trypanosoma rangeli]|eukprot:RNF04051.1 hypothetical protein TraAM80_05328 [Trypanosoma rangeli]